MGFIESYKHLEKLCGEVLNDDRRISAYIDEMINTPRGSYLVKGWDDDLKQLKHYRWVRNQIAHEPDCTEQNMCEPCDTVWSGDHTKIDILDGNAIQAGIQKKIQLQDRLVIHLLFNINDLVPDNISFTYNNRDQLSFINS